MHFQRNIYPVGKGGFASETIEDFTIIFDCGSSTCQDRVLFYIDELAKQIRKVDCLFISHFDKDHVNSIEKLLKTIQVQRVVVPAIQGNMKIVYNEITEGAYNQVMQLFSSENRQVEELSGQSVYSGNNLKWEWTAKNMMDTADWILFEAELQNKGIDTGKLQDAQYVGSNKQTLKDCYSKVFKGSTINEKGLIVLSQKVNAVIESNKLKVGNQPSTDEEYSGCLYTGDAKLSRSNRGGIDYYGRLQGFLKSSQREDSLLLCQIPHHGSQYNSGNDFPNLVKSDYFFVCDRSEARFKSNPLSNQFNQGSNLFYVLNLGTQKISNSIKLS